MVDPVPLGSPYVAYLYSYPHKTAYRPLEEPVALAGLWARQRREALFLYVHIPFCEMRCGFCNLFTTARPRADFVADYLDVLQRQARRVRAALVAGGTADLGFARLAVGGGTPTLLDDAGLERVCDIAEQVMGGGIDVPFSIETSPETASPTALRRLVARGVDRVSIGVQSFVDAEVAAVKRPQERAQVEAALDAIRAAAPATLNIDLMYGLPGQTEASWIETLRAALRWSPEELYLYPLYVRPLTGLGRSSTGRGQVSPERAWDEQRLTLYRLARDLLAGAGYAQVSMRMFRRGGAPETVGPVYCCQEDGLVGIGCGARSYADTLHYATEYAVGARGVKEILEAYLARDDASFDHADYGLRLDDEERRRRFVILSLLTDEGLDLDAYRRRFAADALDELPELSSLAPAGLARLDATRLRLTPAGVERSDAIGPWLHSQRVRDSMATFALR